MGRKQLESAHRKMRKVLVIQSTNKSFRKMMMMMMIFIIFVKHYRTYISETIYSRWKVASLT